MPIKRAATIKDPRWCYEKDFDKVQRALTLDAALRRPDATDAFGKERIENPATYQAPKTMTPEEAAAKTAELRKAAAEAAELLLRQRLHRG